jgi:hypothetical protein
MSESDFTPAPTTGKPGGPPMPCPDSPLFVHAAGTWAKKLRGKLPVSQLPYVTAEQVGDLLLGGIQRLTCSAC